jgi:hypothetical protein
MRMARIYAWLIAVTFAATTWVASRGYGADATVMSLVARAAGTLAWVAGFTALGLSAPPKDEAFRSGALALAVARGFSGGDVERAEMAATTRLLLEVVTPPLVALSLFVWLVDGQGKAGPDAWSLVGSCTFSVVSAVILGVVASACRQWGHDRGRTWFLLVVLLPWPLAELVLPSKAAELASIPGLLGLFWDTLTQVTG